MKTKIWKILGVVASFAMVLSLAFSAVPVAAAEQSWSKVAMPAVVGPQDEDFEVGPIAVAPDGTIYAAVYYDPDGEGDDTAPEAYYVLQSNDDGYTWESTTFTPSTDPVIALDVAGNGVLYVATETTVYRVAANTPQVPLRALPADVTINSMDTLYAGGYVYVMVGTSATPPRGDVYVLEDNPLYFSTWQSQQFSIDAIPTDYEAALWVAFDPNFVQSSLIWAAGVSGTDVVFSATIAPGQWGHNIENVAIPISDVGSGSVLSATAAFVEGYSPANPMFFAAINTDDTATSVFRCQTGPIDTVVSYEETSTTFTTVITSIDDIVTAGGRVLIGGNLLVDSTDSAVVMYSDSAGAIFTPAIKQPTGTYARIAVAPGFNVTSGKVYAGTSGADGGFSLSTDGGRTFNQVGLINTTIGSILDVAFKPGSTEALMITYDGATSCSLWRTGDVTKGAAVRWMRILQSSDEMNLVDYSLDGAAIFLYVSGQVNRSMDGGQTFSLWRAAVSPINDWVMPNADTMYAATTNGFWGTTQYGYMPSSATATGVSANLVSIDLSGNALVVGNGSNQVFYSPNRGYAGTWSALGTIGILDTTPTYVAFAEGSDVMVYATAGGALMRLTDASADAADLEWVTVVSASTSYTLNTADAIVTAPGAGNDFEGFGMAYVTDSDEVLRVRGVGPAVTTGGSPAYESIGAPDDVEELSGLWYTPGSNVLWTIADNTSIWTYTDILNVSGSGVAASDLETTTCWFNPIISGCFEGIGGSSGTITFNALPGATEYLVMVDTEARTNFYYTTGADVRETVTPAAGATTVSVEFGGLDAGTTYYVSVWASAPVSSFLFGGAPVSFTTPPGAPGMIDPIMQPKPGALNVPTNPTFQWMEVTGAARYEFQLATDPGFTDIVAEADDITGVFYAVEGLDYETAYYWRVRAVMADGTAGPWVASVFSTMAEPLPPVTVTLPPVTNTVTQTVTPPAQTMIITTPGPTQTVTPPAQTVIITTPGPAVTVTAPAPSIQPAETPTYVWAIVGIGAVLVIAIIVLIVRTRRVA